MLVERQVLTDEVVDETLYLAQLLVSHLGEMREVEAQRCGRYERALLLYVVAEHLLQSVVEQVGSGVVGSRALASVYVYASHEVGLRVLRQSLHDVYRLSVLALCVSDCNGLVLADEHAGIAYLTAHLAVERRIVEHELEVCILLLCHLAIAQDVALVFGEVVAYELLFAFAQDNPVGVLNGGSVACAFLLLLHLGVELVCGNGESVLAADKLGEVEREAVCVEQTERLHAVELCLALLLQFVHSRVEHVDALLESAQERVFLLLDNVDDEVVLSLEFGERLAHLACQNGDELVEEAILLSEEGICVAHGTAQDAADYVASLSVRRQLSVGDRERYGAQVVCAYAHSHVGLLLLAVLHAGDGLLLLDDRLEDVGVVVGVLALHSAHEALEAHTGIDNVHRQRNERAVSLALVLHEHDVPDLDNLRVVLVHEFTSGHLSLLLRCTRVEVNLRARTAGARIAHFPEVVVLVAVDDVVGGHVLRPI